MFRRALRNSFSTQKAVPFQTPVVSSKLLQFTNRRAASISTMASATSISLSDADTGVLGFTPRPGSAAKASQLLQTDMETHNIFFNQSGFHNHIAHQILSLYGLNAPADDMQQGYSHNSSYQLPAKRPDEGVVEKLKNKEDFRAHAGKRAEYANFFTFFQREIQAKGVGPVINEYIFAGGEFADDMLVRLYGGLLHPIIHLGFGLEFNQPAIVAQALAQTAVHEANLGTFLLSAEKAAGEPGKPGNKNLVQLQDELRGNGKIQKSVRWEDSNKIFDGVMNRDPEDMIRYAAQFTVGTDQVDQKLAELVNAAVYFTGAAQNPAKKIKFDFFYMHSLNSAIFLPTFLAQPWLSTQNKVRLLEWKGRMDLLVYVSRGCVEPRPDDITNYKADKSWEEVFASVCSNSKDDGHAAKFIRLLAYGEKECKPFEGKDGFPIKGDMWLKLANMLLDSISGTDDMWVRSAGFPEAWHNVPDRGSRL